MTPDIASPNTSLSQALKATDEAEAAFDTAVAEFQKQPPRPPVFRPDIAIKVQNASAIARAEPDLSATRDFLRQLRQTRAVNEALREAATINVEILREQQAAEQARIDDLSSVIASIDVHIERLEKREAGGF